MSTSAIEDARVLTTIELTDNSANKRSYGYAQRFVLYLMTLALLSAGAPLNAQEKATTLDALEMRLATLPQGTAGMMAEYVPEGDGRVFLLGGYRTNDGSGSLELSRDVLVYDPALDEFGSFGSLPIGLALAAHAYVPEENAIYLFGGFGSGMSRPVS
jgi:hypothetical protein